jgi:hypothetical protein
MMQWLEVAMLAEREAPRKAGPRVRCLSIDMPASLHRRFRLACMATDKIMVEEVLAFIERRTAELENSTNTRSPHS